MKVLITGGCGFIGSHITECLVQNGFKVVVVDNLSSGNYKMQSSSVIYYDIDYRSDTFAQIFAKEAPDYVIHLAAQSDVKKSADDPLYDTQLNVLGVVQLLKLCQEHGVERFIFASTSAVYGDQGVKVVDESTKLEPISFYGVSKLAAELYIKQFNQQFYLPYTIFRYSNVYGPRQRSDHEGGVIPIFLNKLLQGQKPIIYGDGSQTRDFVHVKDVARANLLALQSKTNETMNISSNQCIPINELLRKITGNLHSVIQPDYQAYRPGDILFSQLNNDKARKLLNWEPVRTLDEGIEEMIEQIRMDGGGYVV
ncbi:NAD-dependent epimerase/dehydratase family protein [Pseudalkalibacillus sp. Hm43]|uniref:NAD-dependent epimerase/dehydratase family protein n=1 Tax=Pseudalkalibacillus sp. Hm43 TaxID=3450742 RepID=UPI003F41C0A7